MPTNRHHIEILPNGFVSIYDRAARLTALYTSAGIRRSGFVVGGDRLVRDWLDAQPSDWTDADSAACVAAERAAQHGRSDNG